MAETVVGTSLQVEGELKSQGDIRIEGGVSGSIETEGSVTIGAGAIVKASIKASNIDIAGTVEGDISTQGHIALSDSASVNGNLQCTELTIARGAKFNGGSSMGKQESTQEEVVVPDNVQATADV